MVGYDWTDPVHPDRRQRLADLEAQLRTIVYCLHRQELRWNDTAALERRLRQLRKERGRGDE